MMNYMLFWAPKQEAEQSRAADTWGEESLADAIIMPSFVVAQGITNICQPLIAYAF